MNQFGQRFLGPPRHPSQLYEAFLEGIVLFGILSWMFWKTDARYQPGKLVGAFLFFYGIFRFGVEFIREPDSQLIQFAQMTHLHMGQWLSVPMILGGLYLMWTAKAPRPGRRHGRHGERCLASRKREVGPDAARARASRANPGRGPDHRRSLYGRLQRLLLRDPRPVRARRRFRHRARGQPDVRRDDRRGAGRLLATGGRAGGCNLRRTRARARNAGERRAAGASARRVSRARSISSRRARCCAGRNRSWCLEQCGTI